MSVIPIRSISVRLDRNVAPATGEAFAGVPLTVAGALPDGLTFEGATRVWAELHSDRNSATGPLATSDELGSIPDGQTVELTFAAAAMQLDSGKYFVTVFASYSEARIETLRVAELRIFDGAASFRKRVYWGSSPSSDLDADGIAALEFSALATGRARSFMVNGNDGYIYYAYPEEWGEASFAAFGLPTSGWVEYPVDLVAGNIITRMRVYRTPAVQAGDDIEITVS